MKPAERQSILDRVSRYYSARLEEFGTTARGVDWNGEASHELRHRQFLRLLASPTASVLDLGCGFGDFYRFLRANGHLGPFIGLDVSAGMIDAARELYGESADCLWKVGALQAERADYVVASGLLNVRGDVPVETWDEYILDLIDSLAAAAEQGFAFNVLSLSSDPARRRSDLYYANPAKLLELCIERYGRSVALLQDYGLYEFTILVRHDGRRHPCPR